MNINSSLVSIGILNNLNRTQLNLHNTIEKMSSGLRINSAKDDASGCAISSKMNVRLRGNDIAQSNTQQANNLLATAESSINSIMDMARRIRELSLKSINSTYSEDERNALQEEVSNLSSEMKRIKQSTKYSSLYLFQDDEIIQSDDNSTVDTIGTYQVEKLTKEEALKKGYTLITSAQDLADIAKDTSGKYILMDDIDLDGVEWKIRDFSGELNGNGYTIKNLDIDNSTNALIGLFGINFGTIKNLNVENFVIKSSSMYIGALCGQNKGVIENCSASVNIVDTDYDNPDIDNIIYIGGITGASQLDSKITNCSADIQSKSRGYAGGIAGFLTNTSTVSNCSSTGYLDSKGRVGGIIGVSRNSVTIESCYSDANINSTFYHTGGFIGYAQGTTIRNCYSTGTVTSSDNAVGGFAGRFAGDCVVENCYTTSKVNADGARLLTGGFVGDIQAGTSVSNCYSSNIMQNPASTDSGSFYGRNAGTVQNCYSNNAQSSSVEINQDGVTAQPATWFNSGENLSFLGENFDYSTNPPKLKTTKNQGVYSFHVGSEARYDNTIEIKLGFQMDVNCDVTTSKGAESSINKMDKLINALTNKLSDIGSAQNRIDSIFKLQTTTKESLNQSIKTILDNDYAQTTLDYAKNKILEDVQINLLTQANQLSSNVFGLLNYTFA